MSAKKRKDVQSVLQRLESWQGDKRGQAQRRFKRFAVRAEGRLWSGPADAAQQAPTTVQLRDISRGGAGFLSNQPATIGEFWQMQLVDSNVSVATLPVFCRFCRQVTDGAYLIGGEFGVEASLLLAMGVPAKEIAAGDESETDRPLSGDFVDPGSLLESDVH